MAVTDAARYSVRTVLYVPRFMALLVASLHLVRLLCEVSVRTESMLLGAVAVTGPSLVAVNQVLALSGRAYYRMTVFAHEASLFGESALRGAHATFTTLYEVWTFAKRCANWRALFRRRISRQESEGMTSCEDLVWTTEVCDGSRVHRSLVPVPDEDGRLQVIRLEWSEPP